MTKVDVRVEVRGLAEAQRKIRQTNEDLLGQPLADAFGRAAQLAAREAKVLAPVDTGQLRASITGSTRVTNGGKIVQGIVGSNVAHAPYQELGTGTFAGKGRVKFPPPDALERWARRHGFGPGGGFLVARAIWRRGGLRGKRFLHRAIEQSQDQIVRIISTAVERIVSKK